MRAKCPCGFVMEVPDEKAGTTVRCPQCGRLCRIPGAKPPAEEVGGLDFGEEFELEEPGAPPGAEEQQTREEAAPAGQDLEFDSQEFQLETPPQPAEEEVVDLRADQILAVETPEAVPERAGRRGRGEEDVPKTIFGLIWMCIKRPSLVSEIGIGGISDPSLLLQIVAAFGVLIIVPSLMEAYVGSRRMETTVKGAIGQGQAGPVEQQPDAQGAVPAEAPVMAVVRVSAAKLGVSKFVLKIGSWFIVGLSLYIIGSMAGSPAGFFGILTGLAFVRVLAVLMLLALGAVAGLAGLLSLAGILPSAAAMTVLGLSAGAYLVFAFIFQIYLLMGIFDVGCFGAIGLNFAAPLMAAGLQMWLAGVVFKLLF